MIIEAKSTRQPTEPVEGRKRFEFNTPERLSKLPLYIAMIAVGIASYVKNAFDSKAVAMTPPEAAEAPQPRLQDPVNWCVPSDERLVLALLQPEIDETETGSISAAASGPRNTIGQGMPWLTDFLLPDSPALVFPRTFEPYNGRIGAIVPVTFGTSASNDNGSRVVASGRPAAVANGDDGGSIPPRTDPDTDEDDDDAENPRVNRAPTIYGPVRLHDVFAGQVMLIGLSALLAGAHDADGDTLTITSLQASGAAVLRSADGWTVATEHGSLGPVTFTYVISDGQASVTQTASFDIVRNREVLTPDDDVHAGTPYDDDIDALEGDDIIDALAGNDLVVGGAGDDHILGGDGDDHLFGNAGDDVIFGGRGNDIISGGEGNDRLFGDDGDDVVAGDAGADQLYGGNGNDILHGGDGDDTIVGDAGNDALAGDSGDDTLSGGAGHDVLRGGVGADTLAGGDGDDILSGDAGNDTVTGGAGNDQILGDAGDDWIDGGDDHDILDMSAACEDLFVDMTQGIVCSDELGADQFTNIEQIMTGAGDDIIVFGATGTVTSGGEGRDTFVFVISEGDATLSEDVVHDILDFMVGDRIRVLDYDISRQAEQAERDLFRSVYEDEDDDWLKSDLPIIVRHERYDDVDQTIIMADVNRDDIYEITINIFGMHLPVNTDHNLA